MSDDVDPRSASPDPRAQALIRDGRAHFAQGDVERARQCFAAAVAIAPDDAAARAGLDRCRRLLAEGLASARPSASMPIEGRGTVEIRGPIELRPELPLGAALGGDEDDGPEATVVDPHAQRLIDAELARARGAGSSSRLTDDDDDDAGPDDQTRVEHDPGEQVGRHQGGALASRIGAAGGGDVDDRHDQGGRGRLPQGEGLRGDHYAGAKPHHPSGGEGARGDHYAGELPRAPDRGGAPVAGPGRPHDPGPRGPTPHDLGPRGPTPHDLGPRGPTPHDPGRGPGAPHGERAPYDQDRSRPFPALPAGRFAPPGPAGVDPAGSQAYPAGPHAGYASNRFPVAQAAPDGRRRAWLIAVAAIAAAAGIAIVVGYAASGDGEEGSSPVATGAGAAAPDGGSTEATSGAPASGTAAGAPSGAGAGASTSAGAAPGAAPGDRATAPVPALSPSLAPGAAEVRVGRIEHPVVAVVVASTDGVVERIHVKAGGSVTTGQKLYSLRAGKGVRSSEAIVSASAAGRIERRAARGDRVAKGDVLAQLVDPDQWLVIADLRSEQVTTGWTCIIATAEGRNRAPCRVESVQRLGSEKSRATVTVATAQAAWLEGGEQALLLRLGPPGDAIPPAGASAPGGSAGAGLESPRR